MNKSLIFQRAWNEHKVKLRHNCASNFSNCLKTRMLGENFR